MGQRAIDKEALSAPVRELNLHGEYDGPGMARTEVPSGVAQEPTEVVIPRAKVAPPEELREALQLEAYSWPRLVFPPLKRSGHVILDSCTSEGGFSLRRLSGD